MNYTSMTNDELVNLFACSPNDYRGVMAAHELVNRLVRGDYVMVDADEYRNLTEAAEAAEAN